MRTRQWISAIAVPALLATGCVPSGSSYSPEALGLDHTTATSGGRPPAPVDPASGVLARAWRTDLRGSFAEKSTRYAFAAGHLLVVARNGVDAVGTARGTARWHYRENRRVVGGHAVTGGVFVLTTWGSEDDPRTVGLDAATGEELWHSADYRPVAGAVQPSGRGVVAMAVASDRSKLAGIDARTGERRWTWSGPKRFGSGEEPCRYIPHDSDGGLLLIQTVCGPEMKLHALDPASGKTLWKRIYQPGRSRAISRAGVTLVPSDTATTGFSGLVLVGRDGRELHRLKAQLSFPLRLDGGPVIRHSLAVGAGRAVIGFKIGVKDPYEDNGRRLASVDLRTGKAGEPVKTRLDEELVTVGDRVHGYSDHLGDYTEFGSDRKPELVPAALNVVDPRTLRTRRVPLPSAAASGFWATEEPPGKVLLDGGRAYTAVPVRGGLRLTAYAPAGRAAESELGGVRPEDWPDACELGTGMKGIKRRGGYSELEIEPHRISRWGCQYLMKADGHEYRVWMAWVARDAAEAHRMLASESVRPQAIGGLGDEAYARSRPEDMLERERIVLRVGRYIAVVEARHGADANAMAETVARNLSRPR